MALPESNARGAFVRVVRLLPASVVLLPPMLLVLDDALDRVRDVVDSDAVALVVAVDVIAVRLGAAAEQVAVLLRLELLAIVVGRDTRTELLCRLYRELLLSGTVFYI